MEGGKKTGVASIEVIRVLDEDGNEILTPFAEIEDDLFPEDQEFVDVIDMEFDSSLVTSSEYAKFRAFKKQLEKEEEDSEAGLSFAIPKKISWGVIGIFGTIFAQGLIGAIILYNSQQNFNDKVIDRLDGLDKQYESIVSSTYTKKEEDLRYDNLKLELNRQRELLDLLRQDVRGGSKQ